MAANENSKPGGGDPCPGSHVRIGAFLVPTWSIVAEQLGKQVGAAGISAVAVFTMEPDPARGPESVKVAMHVFAVTERLAFAMREALQPLIPSGGNLVEESGGEILIHGAN